MADPAQYLLDLVHAALGMWPDNRSLMIACHGHSVPAGYFATPLVDTFSAYPHLWHRRLKERFPWAIFNVVTTAIGHRPHAGRRGLVGADKPVCDQPASGRPGQPLSRRAFARSGHPGTPRSGEASPVCRPVVRD
jgi:hypothetical protein